MKRMAAAMAAAVLSLAAAPQEKRELRYAFKAGETFPMNVTYRLAVKLDKIPEVLQGGLGEDLLDVKFTAALDMTVKEVGPDGHALLEGRWKSATAKGHMMVRDIDFKHPSAAGEKKPAAEADPDLQGMMDMEENLRQLVAKPLVLSVDPQGRATPKEVAGTGLADLDGPFRSLGGLAGVMPKEKVGQGDTWKDETKLLIPAAGQPVEIKLKVGNTYAEHAEGRAVIRTTFAVDNADAVKKADPNNPLPFQLNMSGSGEGTSVFAPADGRLVSSKSALKVKVAATIQNPGGGEDLELKATVSINQANDFGK
ncbi:MAG TPA: hypothetical protein VEJ18_13295 [Planctomycetota bacterium]|nr:hypothetical protein [Planctomycetota bacterium]